MPKTATLSAKEFAKKISSLMAADSGQIEAFVKICITGTLELTVENGGDVMADTQPLSGTRNFSKEAIARMKQLKLEEIQYGKQFTRGANLDSFKIYATDINNPADYIEFSDRAQSNLELRGQYLRDQLDALKKDPNNEDMTLYDAIAQLRHDPKQRALLFLSMLATTNNLPSKDRKGDEYDKITQFFIQLSIAGIKYIEENRKNGISDEQSVAALVSIIKKREIFPKDWRKPIPADEQFLEMIKEEQDELERVLAGPAKESAAEGSAIQAAAKWIEQVRNLAKEHKDSDIRQVADAAEKLLDYYLAQSKMKTKDDRRITELTENFTSAVAKAEGKKEKKLHWKSSLFTTPFIESIGKLMQQNLEVGSKSAEKELLESKLGSKSDSGLESEFGSESEPESKPSHSLH